MRTRHGFVGESAWVVAAMLLVLPGAYGQQATQSFTLRAGWNAIVLEVEPTNTAPAVVFAGLPISSAWLRSERLSSAEFVQDMSEGEFNNPGWQAWFPPGRPEAFLGNLFAVLGERAYFLKLTNAVASWSVTGRPSARLGAWVPDAYNLRGFPVSAEEPPTFQAYFGQSPAHVDPATGQLGKIFRLSAAGTWGLVAGTDRMQRGEAYWVYCRGASDFGSPVEVRLQAGTGVDFGTAEEEFELTFGNRTGSSQPVTVRLQGATDARALAYRVFVPAQGGYVWSNLPPTHVVTVPAQSSANLRLGIRRGAMAGAVYSAQLEITDPTGSRRLVPVAAAQPAAGGHVLQGLWLGEAQVTAVGEVNATNGSPPTPTAGGFPLRLLVHVDTTGKARFLKEVIQMWKAGSYTNNAEGLAVVDKPGRYVLLTDDRLLGQFSGATLRDGVPVGKRLSTVGFDFDGGPTNYLLMQGAVASSNRLSVTIPIPPGLPTNPFRHKYHPDHDNLDSRFVALSNNWEAYEITRQIELEFRPVSADGAKMLDPGRAALSGVYRETLTGLHKKPIQVEGTFQLTRAVNTGELNPSPNP